MARTSIKLAAGRQLLRAKSAVLQHRIRIEESRQSIKRLKSDIEALRGPKKPTPAG